MFKTIFAFEIKRWFKDYKFYLYIAIFFVLAFLSMASSVGYFDNFTTTTASNLKANSPLMINALMNVLTQFVYFIIPTVIGATIYRDFKYNTHAYLYSFPITKKDYILSKFFSGFLITVFITLGIAVAFLIATMLPFANQDLLVPIDIWAYFQSYILFVIPNIFFVGSLAFLLVTLSRNVSTGLIMVILLFIINGIISVATQDIDDKYYVALFEPSGGEALAYITKYWTIDEQNQLSIPFTGVILYNRLIWIGMGILLLLLTYVLFSFNYQTFSLKRKSKKGKRLTKNNFDSIFRLNLPSVKLNYGFADRLKTAIRMSRLEFRFIIRNWIFIAFLLVLLLFIGVSGANLGSLMGTNTHPVTWRIISSVGGSVTAFSNLLIFLFAGILIQQSAISRMNLLVDSSPIPNWALLLSKFIAMVKMVLLIYVVGIIACIVVQASYGYYNFEIGQYLQHYFVYKFLGALILIVFSLFIQNFFKNYIVGFFVILLLQFLPVGLNKIGVELDIFHFNSGPGVSYSDMNGYGSVRSFFYYKLYWLLFCGILYAITLLFWRRGLLSGVKERLQIAKSRLTAPVVVPMLVLAVAFVGLGYGLYYQDTKLSPYFSNKEWEQKRADYEKTYKKYQYMAQPRIVDVFVDMNIYPEERNYDAKAKFALVNKTDVAIDTIYLDHSRNLQSIEFDKSNQLVLSDTIFNVRLYQLDQPLMPGDTLKALIKVANLPNTWLKDRSPIIENGTFVNNMSLFPRFAYNEGAEISHNDIREKYDLPPKERMADPTDSEALKNTYIAEDADWINFETVVSTSADQIAIAPGYLQANWEEDGRRFFHYKMDQKMLNFYAYNSARFEVKKEKHDGVNFEIYYHKGHEYNLDRMMLAMKESIAYYSKSFSPYQFQQARIIEFPRVFGIFAQAFANTMPFSEGIGFIAKVDDEDPNAVDYPFSVTSHEMAHQWWAHQVIGANVKGATLMSESMAEYSSLKVLENRYGKSQMHKFLKDALDGYLSGRNNEWKTENPLMYNENQQYIHYKKGSLVLYAFSDLLGEDNFNKIIQEYVQDVAFEDAPYTTSIDFVNHLKQGTPDSLQYFITDMFETITVYDNKVVSTKATEMPDGKYRVELEFNVSKYRSTNAGTKVYKDEKGHYMDFGSGEEKISSLPLKDYVEIGVFGEKEKVGKHKVDREIYLKKYYIDKINNKISIIVDEKPTEIGVDPYNKLIDIDANDNRKSVD